MANVANVANVAMLLMIFDYANPLRYLLRHIKPCGHFTQALCSVSVKLKP